MGSLVGGLGLGLLSPAPASGESAPVVESAPAPVAEAAPTPQPKKKKPKDEKGPPVVTDKNPWVPLFELSLADTQFFAANTLSPNLEQIVPTSAALFLAEFFLSYRWRILTFFHLPLGLERSIVDGELKTSYSPPGIAAGLALTPWWKDFRKHKRLEVQVALVGGVFLKRDPSFFPMAAVRLYLLHAEDMGLYLGFAYAFAPGTAGLIYGFGYRF